jgi:hypothetical protein
MSKEELHIEDNRVTHLAGRSLVSWTRIKNWCLLHSNRMAAIYTPEGRYEIKFVPQGDQTEIPNASATE